MITLTSILIITDIIKTASDPKILSNDHLRTKIDEDSLQKTVAHSNLINDIFVEKLLKEVIRFKKLSIQIGINLDLQTLS